MSAIGERPVICGIGGSSSSRMINGQRDAFSSTRSPFFHR